MHGSVPFARVRRGHSGGDTGRAGFARRPRLGPGERLFLALAGTEGFLETYILAVYFAFALTAFAFLFGVGFGAWKDARAKYGYFAEAVEFAARAANVTGDVEEVVENEGRARQYFQAAMGEMVGRYRLDEFRAVGPGEAVPGGRARAPGYLARVTVPVFAGRVPLVGDRCVEVPMRYFAVAKSREF